MVTPKPKWFYDNPKLRQILNLNQNHNIHSTHMKTYRPEVRNEARKKNLLKLFCWYALAMNDTNRSF